MYEDAVRIAVRRYVEGLPKLVLLPEHFDAWFTRTHGVDAATMHPDLAMSFVYELYRPAFEAHLELGLCAVEFDFDFNGPTPQKVTAVDCAAKFGGAS